MTTPGTTHVERTVCCNGYVRIKHEGEWWYEHRLNMSYFLGRPLHPNEHVKHLDGDRENNFRDNLLPYYQGGPPTLEAAVEHAEYILKLVDVASIR